jgi:hypothetical protein
MPKPKRSRHSLSVNEDVAGEKRKKRIMMASEEPVDARLAHSFFPVILTTKLSQRPRKTQSDEMNLISRNH